MILNCIRKRIHFIIIINILIQFNSNGRVEIFSQPRTENFIFLLVDTSECFTIFFLGLQRERENVSTAFLLYRRENCP